MADTILDDRAQAAAAAPPPAAWGKLILRGLKPLASLKLTVVLLALSSLLVVFGTLAQVDAGIHKVLWTYFRCFFVWVPLQIFVPRTFALPSAAGFPFPGGYILGGLMLINLLAAHWVRFKFSVKRIGIILTHLGLMLLLVGELVTALGAVESSMTLEPGESVNFTDVIHETELAILDRSDPKNDRTVVIPQALLKPGNVHTLPDIPFSIRVDQYMDNTTFVTADGRRPNPATAGSGLNEIALPRPEVSGTDKRQTVDLASAYVTVLANGTQEKLNTYLVSLIFTANSTMRQINDMPQLVTINGKSYELYLRFKREYKPYILKLLRFTHERYVGTNTPKDFRSKLLLIDPSRQTERTVEVYMNAPLWHGGEIFYQSSVLPGDKGTVLQVVRNPGWALPYLACALMTIGLSWHFLQTLVAYLLKRAMV
jgi:hypothetical protein